MRKTALVTGCNRGIGLALCRALQDRGYAVIAAVRHSSPDLDALGVEVLTGIDVATTEGVENLVSRLGTRSLSLLINNAGIMRSSSLDRLDPEGIREQFEVNALAPLRLTAALRLNLEVGAKVALITSRMGSITDNTSGGSYGYRMSKSALNAVGKSLALDLAPAAVAVALLHPGWVSTDMTGHGGLISTGESASLLLDRIDGLNQENSGTFWHANGDVLGW